MDLSGTGVRVRKSGRPGVSVGQVVAVTLRSDQCHVTLKSRVVRIKRNGLRECEIGLAFVEIRPGLRNALHHLARFGFIPNLAAPRAGEEPQPEKKHKSAIPDYYGLLKISPNATDDQIRQAYHEAARKYHPDANRSADRVFMFEAVSEAYRILRDPPKRREYDQRRSAAHAA
jgi:DnaJ-domain-containing protein 1